MDTYYHFPMVPSCGNIEYCARCGGYRTTLENSEGLWGNTKQNIRNAAKNLRKKGVNFLQNLSIDQTSIDRFEEDLAMAIYYSIQKLKKMENCRPFLDENSRAFKEMYTILHTNATTINDDLEHKGVDGTKLEIYFEYPNFENRFNKFPRGDLDKKVPTIMKSLQYMQEIDKLTKVEGHNPIPEINQILGEMRTLIEENISTKDNEEEP